MEQAALLPLPILEWDPTPVETCLVQRDCFISYGANRYSVPHRYVGQHVTVKADLQQLRIDADTTLIATHAMASGTGQMIPDPAHDAGLLPSPHVLPHPDSLPPSLPPTPTGMHAAHPAWMVVVERRPLLVCEALCEEAGGMP